MYRRSSLWRPGDPLLEPDWFEDTFGLGRGSRGSAGRRPAEAARTEAPAAEAGETKADEEEYKGLLQQFQADFTNYKRRVEREREEQSKYATGELILKLLPVLDDFDNALSSVPEETAEADWVRGIALIERKLRAALEEEGMSRIEAEGEAFDPREHEAVCTEPCEEGGDSKVKTVLRTGYRLHDRVIRPAQVSGGRGVSQSEEEN